MMQGYKTGITHGCLLGFRTNSILSLVKFFFVQFFFVKPSQDGLLIASSLSLGSQPDFLHIFSPLGFSLAGFFWPQYKPHLPCQQLLSSTTFLWPLFVFLLCFVLQVYIVFYLYCTSDPQPNWQPDWHKAWELTRGCRPRWSVYIMVKCYVGIDVPQPNWHKAYDVSLFEGEGQYSLFIFIVNCND